MLNVFTMPAFSLPIVNPHVNEYKLCLKTTYESDTYSIYRPPNVCPSKKAALMRDASPHYWELFHMAFSSPNSLNKQHSQLLPHFSNE